MFLYNLLLMSMHSTSESTTRHSFNHKRPNDFRPCSLTEEIALHHKMYCSHNFYIVPTIFLVRTNGCVCVLRQEHGGNNSSVETETKEWLTGIISYICINCQSSNIESVDHVGVPFFPVARVVQDVVESLCRHVLAHDSHLREKTDIVSLSHSNLKNFSITVEYKVHKVCWAVKNLL